MLGKPGQMEGGEKPLERIVKEVNDFLDPIVEKTFNLKARKEYSLANQRSLEESLQAIQDRVENLGLKEPHLDPKVIHDTGLAYAKYQEAKSIMKETQPDKLLPQTLLPQIKKLDENGRLEKEIPSVYGLDEVVKNWNVFIGALSVLLQNDPFAWDVMKARSESKK